MAAIDTDNRTFAVEQRGIEFVPDDARTMEPRQLGVFWFGSSMYPFNLLLGLLIYGLGLPLWLAVLVTVGGGALSYAPVAWGSIAGARSGLPTHIALRATYGVRGEPVNAALGWAVGIIYEIINVAVGVFALNALFAEIGWDVRRQGQDGPVARDRLRPLHPAAAARPRDDGLRAAVLHGRARRRGDADVHHDRRQGRLGRPARRRRPRHAHDDRAGVDRDGHRLGRRLLVHDRGARLPAVPARIDAGPVDLHAGLGRRRRSPPGSSGCSASCWRRAPMRRSSIRSPTRRRSCRTGCSSIWILAAIGGSISNNALTLYSAGLAAQAIGPAAEALAGDAGRRRPRDRRPDLRAVDRRGQLPREPQLVHRARHRLDRAVRRGLAGGHGVAQLLRAPAGGARRSREPVLGLLGPPPSRRGSRSSPASSRPS